MSNYLIRRADYNHFKNGDQIVLPAISGGIVESNDIVDLVACWLLNNFEEGEQVTELEVKFAKIDRPPIHIQVTMTSQPPTEHHPLEPDGVRPMGYVKSKGTSVA